LQTQARKVGENYEKAIPNSGTIDSLSAFLKIRRHMAGRPHAVPRDYRLFFATTWFRARGTGANPSNNLSFGSVRHVNAYHL